MNDGLKIQLDLSAEILAELDSWMASAPPPKPSLSEAIGQILVAALEVRRRDQQRADRAECADQAFAAHLRARGFLPQ